MLLKRLFIAALIGLLSISVNAQERKAPKMASNKTSKTGSANGNIMPFKATEKTLPNGLKIIVVPTGYPNIVSLQIPVQTGSRNEVEAGKSGFAHFFEHMMFRGTKAYPPKAYQEILTKIGARQNAYTTDDFTNYHTTFAKDDLEIMLKVEADRFQNLDYAEEDFKTEARAVLGEYNKNSANPINKLLEVQRDSAFNTHTYKHTTMGFIRDIEDMPNQYQYSRTFFDRWYRPENTTIIVAGDVNPAKVIPLIEKYWSGWKRGSYKVDIEQEPAGKGQIYAHVPWKTPTLPFVTVAFRGPAFSDTEKDAAALDTLLDLYFGSTSDLYKRLVEQEQKTDSLFPYFPQNADPSLATLGARLKDQKDALYVRDALLQTIAQARTVPVSAERLNAAKTNARYGFVRTLDNTESIASTLATFVRYNRSYNTINNYYRLLDTLTPEDLLATAQKYLQDDSMIITTLSQQPMPAEIGKAPALATFEHKKSSSSADLPVIAQNPDSPLLNMKLLFTVGSAYDPAGKEGLAALAAAMITDAGSKDRRIDEIKKIFYPVAASFGSQVDKEMTTFTGIVHKDNLEIYMKEAMAQLLDPGFREDDFQRLKEIQLNALLQDLRANNDEELGKERLQELIYKGTPYSHPVLGTVAGIKSITLDDVKEFIRTHYTQANLMVGLSGNFPQGFQARLNKELGSLTAGPAPSQPTIVGRKAKGIEVDIIQKDTIATAISFGFPIEVTRSHPDFAALWLARAWLGEHRSSVSHLYNRIREIRGMNYGDYAYIEAFPGGMFQFFPSANIGRRAQIFEIWIRPVVPTNAHMALRIATHELQNLVDNGLSQEDFEKTREYLMKNVFVMTATQNQQLGYALDSRFYHIDEFTSYMREKLKALTLQDVNNAIKQHLNYKDMTVVMITKDAQGLRDQLVVDGFSVIKYDASKPQELLDEDKVIGNRKLNIKSDAVRITPVDEVFAK